MGNLAVLGEFRGMKGGRGRRDEEACKYMLLSKKKKKNQDTRRRLIPQRKKLKKRGLKGQLVSKGWQEKPGKSLSALFLCFFCVFFVFFLCVCGGEYGKREGEDVTQIL